MTFAAGAKLRPYEILSAIGAGGQGEVYKARDTRLNRTVAIKVLPAQFSDNVAMKARLEREAQTIAGLNHPHRTSACSTMSAIRTARTTL